MPKIRERLILGSWMMRLNVDGNWETIVPEPTRILRFGSGRKIHAGLKQQGLWLGCDQISALVPTGDYLLLPAVVTAMNSPTSISPGFDLY